MITEIKINNYKSLSNFHLKFEKGLNILVGPNGAGKTNIISFFDFLGSLQKHELSETISENGGAGVLFRKVGEKDYSNNLNAEITGIVRGRKSIKYIYSFNIEMTDNREALFYRNQRVQIKEINNESKPTTKIKKNNKYDIDIEYFLNDKHEPDILIHNFSNRKLKSRIFHYSEDEDKNENKVKDMLKRNINPDFTLITLLRRIIEIASLIYKDLIGGIIYNIVPSRIRISEDSSKKPGIENDGSGVYATLHAIKGNKVNKHRNWFYISGFDDIERLNKVSIENIIEYIKLANDSIIDLEVKNNPFDNQLQIHITLKGSEQDSVFPLSAMSDGTIKWISLVTAISTNHAMFSIEEPENYLHPRMQIEMLDIIRNSQAAKNNFVLLSTHSETILNKAEPSEIILTSYKDGKTYAARPANKELIERQIQESGFGLGYFYLAGAIEDV